MAKESSCDLLLDGWNNHRIFPSDEDYAEELQLQEALQMSMICSQMNKGEPSSSSSSALQPTTPALAVKEGFDFNNLLEPIVWEEAISKVIKESKCSVCHGLFCTKCSVPSSSGIEREKQQGMDEGERRGDSIGKQPVRDKQPGRWSPDKFHMKRTQGFSQTTSDSNKRLNKLISKNQNNKGKSVVDSSIYPAQDADYSDFSRGTQGHIVKYCATEKSSTSKSSQESCVVQDDDDDGTFDNSDEYDPDLGPKSHEEGKNSKWFRKFFEGLEALSIEEIDGHKCSCNCPVCPSGTGAVKWFQGLEDLITHAKTEVARSVKLHREFAELLEVEVLRKRLLATPEATVNLVGKWNGLNGEEDHQIVWPPMVIIRNTSICIANKWIGMGSQELLELFSSYAAIKAHHFYGPLGHRGVSILIFESSAEGYLEAESLHRSFPKQGLGRNAWDSRPAVEILQGGKHQLYGYLAEKEELDFFNHHSQGKSKLKFEMKSYRDAIMNQIAKLSWDSQQLIRVKQRLAEQETNVVMQRESVHALSKKLSLKKEEMSKFRQKIQQEHEEHNEEMEFQEKFFNDQIKILEGQVNDIAHEMSNIEEHEDNKME
ncbi:hypothetical protein SLA2020_327640 [Shorea laevis]